MEMIELVKLKAHAINVIKNRFTDDEHLSYVAEKEDVINSLKTELEFFSRMNTFFDYQSKESLAKELKLNDDDFNIFLNIAATIYRDIRFPSISLIMDVN